MKLAVGFFTVNLTLIFGSTRLLTGKASAEEGEAPKATPASVSFRGSSRRAPWDAYESKRCFYRDIGDSSWIFFSADEQKQKIGECTGCVRISFTRS